VQAVAVVADAEDAEEIEETQVYNPDSNTSGSTPSSPPGSHSDARVENKKQTIAETPLGPPRSSHGSSTTVSISDSDDGAPMTNLKRRLEDIDNGAADEMLEVEADKENAHRGESSPAKKTRKQTKEERLAHQLHFEAPGCRQMCMCACES
jgi:hypothetical protein